MERNMERCVLITESSQDTLEQYNNAMEQVKVSTLDQHKLSYRIAWNSARRAHNNLHTRVHVMYET